MNIINQIRKLVKMMFPKKTIKQAYSIDTSLSDTMSAHIDEWERMYAGKASWVDNDEVI